MTIWVDAHLSPAIATWITTTFGITSFAWRDLGLRDAEDPEIFEAAKSQGVIFMTKKVNNISGHGNAVSLRGRNLCVLCVSVVHLPNPVSGDRSYDPSEKKPGFYDNFFVVSEIF